MLLDDRNDRAGVKFADRDLIGMLIELPSGKLAKEGRVEYSTRREMENREMEAGEAVTTLVDAARKDLNEIL